MDISHEDVLQIARLARLGIDESEVRMFSIQLSHILSYVDTIKTMDTRVQSSPTALSMCHGLRDDALESSLPRERALSNAPEADGGCFQVPNIMG